jgi:hypothetical protein
MALDWVKEFRAAVTVCDTAGVILDMNEAAITAFAKYGGRELIGTNLLDCHPEPSRTKLKTMLDTQQTNVYTIEKAGNKTLIYQTPWYEKAEYRGFLEIALPLPDNMPHFNRDE